MITHDPKLGRRTNRQIKLVERTTIENSYAHRPYHLHAGKSNIGEAVAGFYVLTIDI